MKTMFGDVVTGDLEENLITVETESEVVLEAGRVAIVPIDEYNELLAGSVSLPKGGELINFLLTNAMRHLDANQRKELIDALDERTAAYCQKDLKPDQECIDIGFHLCINGNLKELNRWKYKRNSHTYVFNLDDFARTLFWWEHRFDRGSTHLLDGALQEAEKLLPKKDGETAESVFNKYWINWEKTVDKEFEERNKGGDGKFNPWPQENDYLRHEISVLADHFHRVPKPIKYGFVYLFFKHVMQSSLDEFQQDVNECPDYIKSIVDELIATAKKTDE